VNVDELANLLEELERPIDAAEVDRLAKTHTSFELAHMVVRLRERMYSLEAKVGRLERGAR
jgi:hypothetical protein